jgi:membrane-bound lytic murein transglycosylase D
MQKVFQKPGNFLKRWHRHLLTLPVFILLFIFCKWFYNSYYRPLSDTDFQNSFFSNYKFRGVTIPKDLNFCGELIPTSDIIVKTRLEKELLIHVFDQPTTMQLNKKANRWFKIIEPILKRNGVPDDFKYVAIVESGFVNSPDVPKSGGFWGLMVPVAQNYGLEINEQVDERFNIEKSTEAACKCFKENYKKYNNWVLAAAAYDMGAGALDNQIAKQKTKNYFNLDLNEETSRYIYRLLAFKEIISRPEAYGYKVKPRDLYYPIPTYSVKVDSSISDLSTFATVHHSNFETLKEMNPWLLKSSLANPNHTKYVILFPKDGVKIYGMGKNDSVPVIIPKISDTFTLKKKTDSSISEK